MKPFQKTLLPESLLSSAAALAIAGFMSAATASAAMLFSDNFNGTGDLNDREPQVGLNWVVTTGTNGSSFTLANGSVTASGGTSTDGLAFGYFNQPLSSVNPLMVVTFNLSAVDLGLTGISLFTGSSERFFLGYRNNATSFAVAGNGAGIGNNNGLGSGTGTYQFTYDYNTGVAKLYNQSGTEVMSRNATAGLAFDTVRLASGSGKSFSVDSLTIEAVPEPSGVALGALGFSLMLLNRRRRC